MRRQAALALLLLAACARTSRTPPEPPPRAVEAVREVERELGYEPTPNFHETSHGESYELCYLADRFELPDDYEGLELRRIDESACRRLGARRDVFFYAPEALAGVESPVTASLEQAAPQRQDFVVAHEDFHDQDGVRELPPAYKEALSTLVGLVAARETAERRGETPLDETQRYLEKALLINRYHKRVRALYAAGLGRRETLRRKSETFAELDRECRALQSGPAPAPAAFDFCPGALNNAGLAFDYTYTQAYPRVYRLYRETGEVGSLTERLRRSIEIRE